MNEDYLWDRSGPPDPEIARLERTLAPCVIAIAGMWRLPCRGARARCGAPLPRRPR